MSKSDGKSKRLKLHTEIAIVHGGRPLVFLAWEDVASDPNLTCEVLYRTLLRESKLRGGLPPVLYLQLDNCIRENKNTVFIGYLCWLLERGIFKEIRLSFLPVGHTHFDCDQLASCVGWGVRFVDITSVDQLIEILSTCFTPNPDVSVIRRVADVSGLFNPGNIKDFPVGTSRIRFVRGCATKDVQVGRDLIMDPLSPLHWLIRKDTHGKVFIQTKRTVHEEQWSEMWFPFDTDAPRPANREVESCKSGLLPGDLQYRAPKPLAPARQAELQKALNNIRPRMIPAEMEAIEVIAERLLAGRPAFTEDNVGCWAFPDEGLGAGGGDLESNQEGGLRIRQAAHLYDNQNLQNIARRNRKNRGRADNELCLGYFLAITTFYTADTADKDQNDFWVGRISQICTKDRQVEVIMYHTGTKDNLQSRKHASYSVWSGKDKKQWIHVDRILAQFKKFSEKGRLIAAPMLKKIRAAMELNELDAAAEEDGNLEDEQP